MEVTTERTIYVQSGQARLEGILAIPEEPLGVVLFSHGSGSGRMSPRNRFVAHMLQQEGMTTLLIDLLEEWESEDRQKVFDIDLLTERLLSATDWLARNPNTEALQIGYFGASTGAASALKAAAIRKQEIGAVVSRGGRPDLARDYLPDVTAPTLLIVGGNDYPVIPLNEEAYSLLQAPKELVIVPGASHLFEEPGKLDEVAQLAQQWFSRYLTSDE
jgi:putative phosphoribosyl transferase